MVRVSPVRVAMAFAWVGSIGCGTGSINSNCETPCSDNESCSGGQVCQNSCCLQLCVNDTQCSSGYSCNAELGICELVGACTTGGCTGNGDCSGGLVCASGCCSLCTSSAQCATDFACSSAGRCELTLLPPVITYIDGSGSVDQESSHSVHHLRDRLVVLGENLARASFELVSAAGGVPLRLEACAPVADDRAELMLPGDVATGSYTLTAVNQAGSCAATVSLLQGEPGTLDASGVQIIDSINSAIALNPTVRVTGTAAAATTTLYVVAENADPDARSIIVDATELVFDNSAVGLALAAVNRNSHAVVSDGSLASGTNFAPADTAAFLSALNSLGPEHIVIVASRGDVRAMLADTRWTRTA